jgi:hypothetical protein
MSRPDSYDNNIIHTEKYNTPVLDLTAMITIESMLIAVKSGTGVFYVSVWILLFS